MHLTKLLTVYTEFPCFISPTEGDIKTTTHILHYFGNVSGLKTNSHKSIVVPISCKHINLDAVLQDFSAI